MTRVVFTWLIAACVSASSRLPMTGPHGAGRPGTGVTLESGLPEQWSETTGVAWRIKLPGTGVSTPVIAGPHVFVTSPDR